MLLDDFISNKPIVIYDSREKKSLVIQHLKKFEDITVIERPLEIADYLVQSNRGTIAVERKRASDFMASITDRRIFSQIEHLVEYKDARLILEGAILTDVKDKKCIVINNLGNISQNFLEKEYFVHPHAFTSIIKKIQDLGIKIIPTGGPYDTADLLKYWATKGEIKKHISIRLKTKKSSDLDRQLFLMSGLTGIDTKRAESLLKKYGTPMHVFTAFLEHSPRSFPVNGIGEKTARGIRKILTKKIVKGEAEGMLEHEFEHGIKELDEMLNHRETELKRKGISELKAKLKKRGLKVSGKKDELIKRIIENMEEHEIIDIPLFLRKYERLLEKKTEFQRVPKRLEKFYKKFRKDVSGTSKLIS